MLLVAGGHIGLVMLIVKSGWLKRLISRLAAEGTRQIGVYQSIWTNEIAILFSK
jgi:hypothetical protein